MLNKWIYNLKIMLPLLTSVTVAVSVLCVGVVDLTVWSAMVTNCVITVNIYLACRTQLTLYLNEYR